MSKRTEIVVRNRISLFEHRFISGEADTLLEAQHYRDLQEHRLFGVTSEHRVFGIVAEHRSMEVLSEHRTLDIESDNRKLSVESELESLVLDQAKLTLSNPHLVSSVTLQRRSDGSFFLIIEE
jgi:hypothetical protein